MAGVGDLGRMSYEEKELKRITGAVSVEKAAKFYRFKTRSLARDH